VCFLSSRSLAFQTPLQDLAGVVREPLVMTSAPLRALVAEALGYNLDGCCGGGGSLSGMSHMPWAAGGGGSSSAAAGGGTGACAGGSSSSAAAAALSALLAAFEQQDSPPGLLQAQACEEPSKESSAALVPAGTAHIAAPAGAGTGGEPLDPAGTRLWGGANGGRGEHGGVGGRDGGGGGLLTVGARALRPRWSLQVG
jgi:hypothetical protein